MGPDGLKHYTPTEAGAPLYPNWANIGAGALVTGYVQARDDGRITVACYLYDLKQRREMTRKGFVVDPKEWRRAAHRCAGAFFTAVTKRPGRFDSRIAYVAATGSRTQPVKRIAIMNWDGTDHSYLTQGEVTVTSPRLSPDGQRIAYMSFAGGIPHVRVVDVDGSNDRTLAAIAVDELLAALFARRTADRLLHGRRRQHRHLCRRCRRRLSPASDDHAGRRYLAELLARRIEDRVRKRPSRLSAALRHGRRRFRPAAHQLRRRSSIPRRSGARTASGSPSPAGPDRASASA